MHLLGAAPPCSPLQPGFVLQTSTLSWCICCSAAVLQAVVRGKVAAAACSDNLVTAELTQTLLLYSRLHRDSDIVLRILLNEVDKTLNIIYFY